MIKFSFAIPVKDELIELQALLRVLIKNKGEDDEIVIQFDSKNGSKMVEDFLRSHSINKDCGFRWHPYPFEGDFSKMKNNLINMCNGEYIFLIDADEIPNESLINNISFILESNPEVEVFGVPRINIVHGITQEHLLKWRWRLNDLGYINFPDWQFRIFKNNGKIKYKNKVHEQLTGYKTISFFPETDSFSLIHIKEIERQEKQNELYSKLI